MTTMTDQDLLETYDRLFTNAANIIMMCQTIDYEMRRNLLRIADGPEREKILDYEHFSYLDALDLLAGKTAEIEISGENEDAAREDGVSQELLLLSADAFGKLREVERIWKYWAFDGFKYLMGEEVEDSDVYESVLAGLSGKAQRDRIFVREAMKLLKGQDAWTGFPCDRADGIN